MENDRVHIMDKSIDAEGLAREVLKGGGEFSMHMKTCLEKYTTETQLFIS